MYYVFRTVQRRASRVIRTRLSSVFVDSYNSKCSCYYSI